MTGATKILMAVALILACLLGVSPAAAAALPSRPREAPERPAVAVVDLGELAREQVALALQSLGLEPAQVEDRLSRLSRHDLEHLAEHPEQIRVAGGVNPASPRLPIATY